MSAPAVLGLSTYRWNNNLKSMLLLAAFPPLLALLVGAIFYLVGCLTVGSDPMLDIYVGGGGGPFHAFGIAPVLGTQSAFDFALSALAAWWPAIFGIAAVWFLIAYFFNDRIIHLATGAKPVERAQNPRLYNILENLCISRGLTTPKLFLIDTEAMNAYASGIDTRSYAITVTSGLLTQLDDRELEAVLGHELSHIIDRDCRLMIVTIVFTGMVSFLCQLVWRVMLQASVRTRSRKGGGMFLPMLVGAIAFAIGYLLALLLRLAISRRREYLADAGSVDLTKNPGALISALRKIAINSKVPHIPSETQQLFIESPAVFELGGIFATHPPIAKRIAVLEALGAQQGSP